MARPFPRTLLDFQRMFPDEPACVAYLEELRWPDGFSCLSCSVRAEPFRFKNRPTVLQSVRFPAHLRGEDHGPFNSSWGTEILHLPSPAKSRRSNPDNTLAIPNLTGAFGGNSGAPLSHMPVQYTVDRRDGDARDADAAPDVVLGGVPGDGADSGDVGAPVPTAARHLTLRDRFPDASQTEGRDGPA